MIRPSIKHLQARLRMSGRTEEEGLLTLPLAQAYTTLTGPLVEIPKAVLNAGHIMRTQEPMFLQKITQIWCLLTTQSGSEGPRLQRKPTGKGCKRN